MFTLTPTDCRVNDLRIREHLTDAERYAPLRHDAPPSGWRTSPVMRLAPAFFRRITSLGSVRLARPRTLVETRP